MLLLKSNLLRKRREELRLNQVQIRIILSFKVNQHQPRTGILETWRPYHSENLNFNGYGEVYLLKITGGDQIKWPQRWFSRTHRMSRRTKQPIAEQFRQKKRMRSLKSFNNFL